MAVSWDSCYVFRVFRKITFWIFIIFLFLFTSSMIRWCAAPRLFCFLRGRGVGLLVWKLEDVQQPRPYLFILLAWRFRRFGQTNMNVSLLPFDIQTLAFYMAWSYLCPFNYLSTFRSKVPLIFPILSLSRMLRLAAHCTQGALAGRGFIQYENAFRPCMLYTFTQMCCTQVSILCLIFPSPPVLFFPCLIAAIFDRLACSLFQTTIGLLLGAYYVIAMKKCSSSALYISFLSEIQWLEAICIVVLKPTWQNPL